MTVQKLDDDYVKLFSLGKEIGYTGKEIIYDDDSIILLYFYYQFFTRLYIINGKKESDNLVQVKEKCNIIAKFDDKLARRFKRFSEDVLKENPDILFELPEIFFLKCRLLIDKKNWKIDLLRLYEEYKNKRQI